MKSEVASTKLPSELLARVRQLAHLRSLETGREITSSSLIRAAVESYISRIDQSPFEPQAAVKCERFNAGA